MSDKSKGGDNTTEVEINDEDLKKLKGLFVCRETAAEQSKNYEAGFEVINNKICNFRNFYKNVEEI